MSGRKSSEVANVLRQGEEARKQADESISRQIDEALRAFAASAEQAQNDQKTVLALDVQLHPMASGLFGTKAEELVQQFQQVKSSAAKERFPNREKEIRTVLEKLDKALEAADTEGARIRESVKHHQYGWHCDQEYADAQKLVKEYKNLRTQRLDLSHEAVAASQEAHQQVTKLAEAGKRLQGLKQQIDGMNAVAQKRQESDAMRKELEQAVAGIDTENAQKFFADEYQALGHDVQDLISKDDDAVGKMFHALYSKIAVYQTKLTERVERWRRETADAEKLVADVRAIADTQYVEPNDYYANFGDGDKKMELFTFLATYGKYDGRAAYDDAMQHAEDLIAAESFQESMTALRKALQLVEEARDAATDLQEAMLQKMELTCAIQDVMEDLQYSFHTRPIDDNPNNGYRIKCEVGDDIIDFDRIDIDDNGGTVVNIDHTEATGGSCHNSWKEIATRMREAGIPVTDVKLANGTSVLQARKTAGGQEHERRRAH